MIYPPLGGFGEVLPTMDDSSYKLNFNLGKKNEIYHHALLESRKSILNVGKITKFGREIL